MGLRVLVAYSATSTHVSTTLDYLRAFQYLPDCEVKFVHCAHDARLHFDINAFDVLINSYCARSIYDSYLSPDYERAVLAFQGLKIGIVQDDYDVTSMLHRAVRRLGFHVLFTSIQSEFWPLVYPTTQVPGVAFRNILTGYVPASRPSQTVKPLEDRPFPIAYRGRELGAKYGRLGYEKVEIGRRMAEICAVRGIGHNIATDEASRIYGDEWFTFVGDSRTMLGSESGSNAFDFDGAIAQKCSEFEKENGRPPLYSDIADYLAPFEQPFNVGQISPRVFECATMRTPMILFRGRYSDAIRPDEHYIPLEKDFSNVDQVLSRLNDHDYLRGFADRAYEHLIASGNYSYRTLMRSIKDAIDEHYPRIIADKFNQHRHSIAARWQLTYDPSSPHEIALAETPTHEPQLPDYYRAKQARLVELLYPPKQMGAIRRAWRLLPMPVRYRVGQMVGKLIS
jgi:hypothetical protein